MNKECELVRDRQERFNMVRCWFVVAWRLIDPITKQDRVQPWFKTKTEARKFAKMQGWSIISEGGMKTHDQIQQEIDDLFKATPWASHPRFPVEDWQYEVRNNDTRQGYATWLYNMLANDEGEPEGFFFCPACRHEWESAKSEDNCPKCGQYVQEGWDV